MIPIVYRNIIIPLSLVFLLAAGMAAYLQQPAWLAAPLLVLVACLLVQLPLLLFYLLIAAIPWSAEVHFSSGLGTDLPDEPLMWLLSLSVLLLGASRKIHLKRFWHPLLALLLLQVVWILATVITSTYPLLSFKYLLAKCWYLAAFVVAPLVLLRQPETIRKAAIILCTSMALVVLVSLVRHYGDDFRFDAINEAVSPFFRNHVMYSSLLVFTFPLQIALLGKKHKNWLVLTLTFSLAALYLSYSRGAWLALIGGLLAYWLIRKRGLVTLYLLSFLLVAGVVFWLKKDDRYVQYAHDYESTIFHQDLRQHLVATYQFRDMSTAERFYRWIAGVRMLPDSWKTGLGPNTFYHNYKSYTVPAFRTWISRNEEQSTVHNYFLLQLIEQGVLGFLLFTTLVGLMFAYAQRIYRQAGDVFWKRTSAAIASILVMLCILNQLSDLVETDKVGSIFYLCLALLVTGDSATRSKASPDVERVS